MSEGARRGPLVAPFSIAGVVVGFFVSQIVAVFALYAYGSSHGWSTRQVNHWLNDSVAAQFAAMVIAESLLLAVVFGLMRLLRWRRQDIGLRRPTIGQLVLGLATVVPYYLFYVILIAAVSWLVPSFNASQKQDVGFNSVSGAWQLSLTFVSLVVIPPLVEEISMRGFLYTGLRTRFPKLAAAVLVSLLFGAAHLSEGGSAGPLWVGALDTFVLSMFLVWLRERTGNLWAGIVLHASKNGFAFMLLYILRVN